ncbi:calcium-activated potassium channel slowpoke-like isoform X2 [Paramacrobiotus metropolitanus]|uniref:calcium-activated potassium channel slowpoke-like isoform X2 n=1 Tax=Paramacrobiotus metropolitanus TaxID=2943436 RepID=UPI002445DDA0|nr:calcium-activated potassium channel slowpoke-like isoform X2 [Paramacrobiotus metropolitanus]
MDGQGACMFPKPQLIPKVKYEGNDNITLPAPCFRVGEPELVYVYFLIGIILPLLATLFLQRMAIVRFFLRVGQKIFVEKCRPERAADDIGASLNDLSEAGSDMEQPPTAPTEIVPSLNMLKRVRSLMERKARRPMWHRYLNQMSSSQTLFGQILMGVGVFFSCVSLFIYLKYVNRHRDSLELCGTMPNVYQILDVMANLYMLVYFIIRLAGNPKKQKVAVDLHAFGDYFCIPASIIGVGLNRYFTGFTYFRIYNLIWIVDICANRGVVRSANKTRLLKLLVLVVMLVTVSAGFLHLAENLGDPWIYAPDGTPLYNGQNVVYWRCFLFIYGRITWLDLSGIRVLTHTGRIIVYAFQLIAMGIIGKAIPRILQEIKIKAEYDKKYEPCSMFLHIIVCGHVTSNTMKAFLKEFYHIDRYFAEHFKVVVLSDNPPDEAMENLAERYFNKLEYKRGSIMRLKDLRRVNLADAAATLILADRTAADADADDAANIMRVVSVKNFKGTARVIVQIAHYHNKAYLQNIPSWNTKNGDVIICIAELRLGLLAQNCHAPGFSTLMANLFTTRSLDAKTKDPACN